jgi:hypothetical protein
MITQHYLIEKYLNDFVKKIGGYNPALPSETKYYAVIVEPRIDPKMLSVIKNHLYFLNENNSSIKWGLQVFHGIDNQEFIYDILKDIKNVKYVNTGVKDFTKIEYNQYIKSNDFWSVVEGEKILTFQLDTLLLRFGIDEFLKYDYIGAPWSKPKENRFIGNGGLSLRTKDVMLEITKKHKDYEPRWEDIFFVKWLDEYNLHNLPDIETAMKFSTETLFHPDTFGLHNPINISPHLLDLILNKSINNL